jgi:hypothetical protein
MLLPVSFRRRESEALAMHLWIVGLIYSDGTREYRVFGEGEEIYLKAYRAAAYEHIGRDNVFCWDLWGEPCYAEPGRQE